MFVPLPIPKIDYQINKPIPLISNNFTFPFSFTKDDWPERPEQLPPLIPKMKSEVYTPEKPIAQPIKLTQAQIYSKHAKPVNNYEKQRMSKLIRKIKDFQYDNCAPYHWMQENFGKPITQKEFNRIYQSLKTLLPENQAPTRDVNRNQRMRMKWMTDLWFDNHARQILQHVITQAILSSELC